MLRSLVGSEMCIRDSPIIMTMPSTGTTPVVHVHAAPAEDSTPLTQQQRKSKDAARKKKAREDAAGKRKLDSDHPDNFVNSAARWSHCSNEQYGDMTAYIIKLRLSAKFVGLFNDCLHTSAKIWISLARLVHEAFPQHRKSVEAIKERYVAVQKKVHEYYGYLRRAVRSGAANISDCNLVEAPEYFAVFRACGQSDRPVANPPCVADGGGFTFSEQRVPEAAPTYRRVAFEHAFMGFKAAGVFTGAEEEEPLSDTAAATLEKVMGEVEEGGAVDPRVDIDEEAMGLLSDEESDSDEELAPKRRKDGNQKVPPGVDQRSGGSKKGCKTGKKRGPKGKEFHRQKMMDELNASIAAAKCKSGDSTELVTVVNNLNQTLLDEGRKNREHDEKLIVLEQTFMENMMVQMMGGKKTQ
eukprot:TRINITY_DN44280_c0_g1_i1.p1 TRINITY_DN44280_c0_g1~~TRINITY_DN44280_c0_g1_i1.p1  ORF type:complete len:411 (-),score=102.84 TRINITY_DN44280_c0_g1_i1:229-1461(-)